MSTPPCITTFPGTDLACQLREHPHRQAHYAAGDRDGQHFALFWWSPGAALDQPDERADGLPWGTEPNDT